MEALTKSSATREVICAKGIFVLVHICCCHFVLLGTGGQPRHGSARAKPVQPDDATHAGYENGRANISTLATCRLWDGLAACLCPGTSVDDFLWQLGLDGTRRALRNLQPAGWPARRRQGG